MTMCKINLLTGEVRHKIDLDALLEDMDDVATSKENVATNGKFVATNEELVATYSKNVATNTSANVAATASEETVRFRAKRGVSIMLKKKAESHGFNSMSELVRSAIKYALKHPDFKKGWDT